MAKAFVIVRTVVATDLSSCDARCTLGCSLGVKTKEVGSSVKGGGETWNKFTV